MRPEAPDVLVRDLWKDRSWGGVGDETSDVGVTGVRSVMVQVMRDGVPETRMRR